MVTRQTWWPAILTAAMLVAQPLDAAEGPRGIGLCLKVADLDAATAAGYDYIEVSASEVNGLAEEEFQALVARVRASKVPVRAANVLLPGTLRVTGPEVDAARQGEHLERTLDRLAALGVQTVVFGSGKARAVPEGFSREQAFSQLVAFGRLAAEAAARRGMVIVLEPLRRQETNIVNTTAEGLKLVEAVGHPAFQILVDFYHLSLEGEDPAILREAGARLRHVHVANPDGRVFPREENEAAYGPFFAHLRAIGYAGGVSVEASTRDLAADAPASAALLRRLLRTHQLEGL